MNHLNTSSIIRLLCFLILLLIAAVQIRFAVLEQDTFIGKGGAASNNALLLTNAAKQKHLFEADLDQAAYLLQNAWLVKPYYVPAWLALAVVRSDQGKTEQSLKIIDYVHYLTRDIKRWRWDKVLVAYQLGQTRLLPTELSYIIAEIKGKPRKDALQLAFTIWPDPQELLDNIGVENIIHLFKHASAQNLPDQARSLWAVIDAQDIDYQREDLLNCIDMLMRNSDVTAASHIWRTQINPERLLYNGDFSTPFMQKAFGWRKANHNGVELQLKSITSNSESKTLHLRFKGWDNIKYHHFYQIVPLAGGHHYRLTANIKTDKLTTDQRPYLEVYGYQCGNFPYAKSEMMQPSQQWEKITLDFEVPADCAAVVVRMRRDESTQIDSKISGHLWLADMAINPTSSKTDS